MDEHDFEASRGWKPFGGDAVKNAERLPAIALALWGRTTEDLRQQLLAPIPKMPLGCTIADLQTLERQATLMLKSPTMFPTLHAGKSRLGAKPSAAWKRATKLFAAPSSILRTANEMCAKFQTRRT